MGANQWLGLVEKIFIELDRWQADNTESGAEIFISISTAEKILRDLKSKREYATDIERRAGEEMRHAVAAHAEAVKAYAGHVSQSKWTAVQDGFWKHISSDSAAVETINAAGHGLGLRELSGNAEQLDQVLEQAKTLAGRASLMTSSLKAKRYVGNVFLGLVSLVLIGLFAVVVIKLYVNDPKTWLEVLGKGLATISTLVGFFAVLAAAILRNRASQAIDALQDYALVLRTAIQEADQVRNYEQAIAQEKVASSQKDMQDNRARWAGASRNRLLAEQAFDDFMAGGVWRGVSEYYRKLIQSSDQDLSAGVVPTIREDFQSLSRAVTESQRDVPGSLFDRIVVYIDDLDQCPPEVVITVLQAVYLLLAFPLFVVVVVANPLRLLESLKPQYSELESDNENDRAVDHSSTIAALNFLSKLIQIPFWVRPVTQEGAGHLVRHLLLPDNESVGIRVLTGGEIEFLRKMAGFLRGSPRDVKRLANTYRLVRSTIPLDQLVSFTGNEKGRPEYQAVITELTVLIAAPLGSRYFFDELGEARFTDFDELYRFVATTRQMIDSGDWDMIRAILEAYRFHNNASEALNDSEALYHLRTWRLPITRYSFTIAPEV